MDFEENIPAPRARPGRKLGLLVLCGLLVITVTIFLALGSSKIKPSWKLQDGSLVYLEDVTYGTTHSLRRGWRDNLLDRLPRSVAKFFGGANSGGTMSFGGPCLAVWISRYHPAKGLFVSGNWTIESFDEHGCVYRSGGWGTLGTDAHPVNCISLMSFPRHLKSFRCRLLAQDGSVAADFPIQNPAWAPAPKWEPEPLPAFRTNGDLVVKLLGTKMTLSPAIEVFQNGKPAPQWFIRDSGFEDSSGNQSPSLCRFQPAWKMKLILFRKPESHFSEDELYTLKDLTLPNPGEYFPMRLKAGTTNSAFEILALGGPGQYKISNDVCIAHSPGNTNAIPSISTSSSSDGRTSIIQQEYSSRSYFVRLRNVGWKARQRLFLRVTDDQRRVTTSSDWSSGNNLCFYKFEVAPDAKTADIDFIVQTGREFEFLVKPEPPLK
jgi:hypothetical protein